MSRIAGIVLLAAASALPALPAAALTYDQAMAQCRAKFAGISDTEGAPRQFQAIEDCARQMMAQQSSQPAPATPKKKN